MSARTAVPVLLWALFAVPARADVAFPSDCGKGGAKEGDPCQDFYSRNLPGQCRHMKCTRYNPDEEGEDEDDSYDCFHCATPEQFAANQRGEVMRAQQAALAERIRWGLGALGAGCVVTAVWYDWRRRPKARAPAPPPSE
ncbi:MAG TPA: hypothetical protein VE057_14985 [Archangium sp.]|nr:hypothetical protein [Archangium sp.]